MEQLLHYAWKHKIFPLKELQTTAGLPLEVIDPGLPNSNAGPDFFNAKVKINGALHVGNIEIHTASSDWKRHGHHTDKAYDSVILHVASQPDCEVFRSNGEGIPQLQLICSDALRARYGQLCRAAVAPPCRAVFQSLSVFYIHSWLTALQAERFEQKADAIAKRLQRNDHDWENVFFITLARNFGFGLNGDIFETWAGLLSFRAAGKHRDSSIQIEALFFGQAGLLEENIPDEYYQTLQKEYRFLKNKFDLPQTEAFLWRFSKVRPDSFPHVRIAQLACLYHQKRSLFSRIIEAETPAAVKAVLTITTSHYWINHYHFAGPSPQRAKNVGDRAMNLLFINTIIPFLYAYGRYKDDERLCERASDFLDTLKAEDNYIIRSWAAAGLPVHTAADSQALLQLQKEYCDKKKCLYCRFGHEFLRTH